MANWYSGVLKYAYDMHTCHIADFDHSTGKKRYGHPALNGVLPEPWLPLKKGQTLINNSGRNGTRNQGLAQAVVLTLHRRFSGLRRGVRHLSNEGHEFAQSRTTPNFGASSIPGETGNPWGETSSAEEGLLGRREARANTLHHRLSFDPASGVIMLPDNGDWLVDDVEHSSDDEDIGYNAEDAAPERSTAASVFNEDMDANGGNTSMTLITTSPASPSKSSRYATYYHHPERRKQQIPGAFPER